MNCNYVTIGGGKLNTRAIVEGNIVNSPIPNPKSLYPMLNPSYYDVLECRPVKLAIGGIYDKI